MDRRQLLGKGGMATVMAVLLAWYGLFLAQKIDLITADVGRHIKNGQAFVEGSSEERSALLSTNVYSYTMPEAPFINHHWLAGPLFYYLRHWFDFIGVSLFYVFLGIITLFLSFLVAQKASNTFIATVLTLLLLPLLASRTEVRPEMFTYLFSAYFYYVLWHYKRGLISQKWLYTVPVAMILWVNLHIGFIFGVFIIGVFVAEELLHIFLPLTAPAVAKGEGWAKGVGVVFGITLLATLLNPHGLTGSLYPFHLFDNYGYLLVENQSIPFLERLGVGNPQHFWLLRLALGATVVSFAVAFLSNWRKVSLSNAIFAAVFGYMAYNGIRHFPTFTFFAVPLIAQNAGIVWAGQWVRRWVFIPALLVVVVIFVGLLSVRRDVQTLQSRWPAVGLGLVPGINNAAEFVKQNGLRGPIFNNYDIGGYLIYHFYPKEKVFVDNRPEAYSVEFFEEIYKPAQENNQKWEQLREKYAFNTIIFSSRDYTPWGQQFLASRVQDPAWVPVYYDGLVIIFVKQSAGNETIIKQHAIPREVFTVRSL